MPVSRGLHRIDRTPADPKAELAAWQLTLPPGSSFSHLTGAVIRGWWVPPLPGDLPVFAGVNDASPRPRRAGLIVCRHTQPIEVDLVAGLRVAQPGEILLAAARDLGLLDLVVLGDAALHAGDCTLPELRRAAQRQRRGAPVLRRALPYLDARSESAWESVLRMVHRVCDVPIQPQYQVGALRADLWIVGTKRLAEYDGEVHRDGPRHAKDLARQRRLNELGWERYGYTAHVVLNSAVSVLKDADTALGRVHDPTRIRAWHGLLAESLFSAAGTARLRARWAAQRVRHRVTREA